MSVRGVCTCVCAVSAYACVRCLHMRARDQRFGCCEGLSAWLKRASLIARMLLLSVCDCGRSAIPKLMILRGTSGGNLREILPVLDRW
jgi:hypothetical protein